MDTPMSKEEALIPNIHYLRKRFMNDNMIRPTHVNLGHEEYTILLREVVFSEQNIWKGKNGHFTIFGMEVNEVNKNNCLEVGLMIK